LKVYAKVFEMADATAADEHGTRLFPDAVGNELAMPEGPPALEPAPTLH